ncbi:TonB-dependent receptor [Gallaecimonas mangrovi]|uniref:TonB-dependent receptor n=1 Tax=Gallaecimonas mangrovi TaxID=2291597 RepID=UPI00126036CC|nr:TonB-dependent receptor [Gallaecimonas mangrovi]
MKKKYIAECVKAAAIAAVLGTLAPHAAFANETTGSVSGTLLHVSKKGLTAVMTNPATGQNRSVEVTDDGTFRFPQMQVGKYIISIKDSSGTTIKSKNVVVSLGNNTATTIDLNDDNIETISVVGSSISMVDTAATSTGLNIGETQYDKLPVGRDSTSIAMLAPGTVKGDSAFGNLASFGGASVAENAYYINGLNVTDFRNGLGGSSVPFEFYKEFKVKTGGYGAEFGRSTGGVIDAVTKSGTNEFHAGASFYYTPDSLRSDSPNTRYRNGKMYIPNDKDESDSKEGNIWVSGPLIKDKLFFYALYNPRDVHTAGLNSGSYTSSIEGGDTLTTEDSDNAFWGVNLDWYITDNHVLEFTAFNDSRTYTDNDYEYDYDAGQVVAGTSPSTTYYDKGGKNWLLKYTGYWTDDLTVTALYGENKYNLSSHSATSECPYVYNYLDADNTHPSCSGSAYSGVNNDEDKRQAGRLDFEWVVNDHHTLKFGADFEKLKSSSDDVYYSGGTGYYIDSMSDGAQLNNGYTNDTGSDLDYVEAVVYDSYGSFSTESYAYYFEDAWQITDNLLLNIGLRNDMFNNKSASGESFIKIDNQWAPRLGFSWDPVGDGNSRVFGNWGLYYLPIENNTNVRIAGNESYYVNYYAYNGLDSEGVPNLGSQLGDTYVYSSPQPVNAVADQNIKPMYQEEWILGYENEFAPGWKANVTGTYRDLKRSIDDTCNDDLFGEGVCVLINPGYGATVSVDPDGDGVYETKHFTADELGLPKAKRTYKALTFDLKHTTDKLQFDASYTWAKSEGNTEGYVKSDNGQDDAGLTTDWDYPQLMDGAYGDLPNDRRHSFKFYGSYSITDQWTVGWNSYLMSGRPINAFGIGYPEALGGQPGYGYTYYLTDPDSGELTKVSRGSMGRTPWIANLDLSTAYEMKFNKVNVKFSATIFNVMDAHGVTEVYEYAEHSTAGNEDERYGLATGYQSPRSVRLGVEVTY